MNKKICNELFERFRANNPAPKTELEYHSPFELLIAVILSAQATDKSVNKATKPLFLVANTPQAILDLGEDGLKSYIKTIGLFNSKASHIMKTCHILVKQHQSMVPKTRAALEALPGVGRKTANVILNTAFGEPTIAVDTHIFRVSKRIGIAEGNTPLAIEHALLKSIDRRYIHGAHHWLILHGRYICTARKPHCNICIIRDLCEFPNKTLQL
jgi:endonuclease-3